eukprot:TRINITY_DN53464_c0_g1_i2.p2 TRINITY_DN53464_c0_g1~~TRINITY_DN53464_c0_g1_i2.p2  ORF type:complete len:107 (+),score=34.01 TRINITY_DN53464_c0_g1_i2:98-418(+)
MSAFNSPGRLIMKMSLLIIPGVWAWNKLKEREPDEVINERLRRRYKQLDSSDQATRQKKNVGYILDVVNRKREPPGIGVTATKPTNAGDPYPATPSSDADGGSPQQ